MNLYIVRHGQTNYNIEGRFQGQIDVEMNSTGKEQVNKTSDKLKKVKFDKVYVSPLKRTIDTAKIITNESFIVEKRIIERSFGILEGKYSVPDYEKKIEEFKVESVQALEKRVSDFLKDIMNSNANSENILIVTHEAVAQIINKIINNELKENYKKFRLGTGEYIKYEI